MTKRIFKKIHSIIKKQIIEDFYETVWVYLSSEKTKGSAYDPYRETGYTKTNQSPIPIKCQINQLTTDSLIRREIGLSVKDAIEATVSKNEISLLKIAEKIIYKEKTYSLYLDALGDRVNVTNVPGDFAKIVMFRIGN